MLFCSCNVASASNSWEATSPTNRLQTLPRTQEAVRARESLKNLGCRLRFSSVVYLTIALAGSSWRTRNPKILPTAKKRVKLAVKKLKMCSINSCPYWHILKLTLMVATRLFTSTLSRPKKESRLSSHASPLVCTGYWWKRTKRKNFFLMYHKHDKPQKYCTKQLYQ